MTAPIAGWYADPAGDASKLRYWDGTKWTDSCMDVAAATAAPQGEPATAQTQAGTAYNAAYQQPVDTPPTGIPVTPQPDVTAGAVPGGIPDGCAQPGAATQPGAPGSVPNAAQPTYTQTSVYVNYADPAYADAPLYYVNQQDSTLRLIAFILALISTVTAGWAIIPLAWMIPMTVMTWGVYKGKRPNTVAFGVCSLIFLNVVGGILLLVSTKDE